jgi:hypothetical protein
MRHTTTTVCSDKRPVRPPTDHLKRILEEAYPNHAYPIRHKLKDCSMMRSFMTSGYLAKGAELYEGSYKSDMTSFPEENVVMTV